MVIRQRLDTMPANRLVAEGYCLNELAATRDSASQAGRPTYTFAFGGKGGRRFTWNRFKYVGHVSFLIMKHSEPIWADM